MKIINIVKELTERDEVALFTVPHVDPAVIAHFNKTLPDDIQWAKLETRAGMLFIKKNVVASFHAAAAAQPLAPQLEKWLETSEAYVAEETRLKEQDRANKIKSLENTFGVLMKPIAEIEGADPNVEQSAS